MESIFFRRLEPRRSTQTILPNVTSLGGFGNINPSADWKSTCFDYGWPPRGCPSFYGCYSIGNGCPFVDIPSCYAINSIDLSEYSPSIAVGCSYIGGGCSYQALTGQTYGNILGSCPQIDSLGLQSVVGTLGNIFSGSSSLYNIGQYNIGTYNWGGYNRGVSNILGSCPRIDSPGLQSVVGTLGNIFNRGFSAYNLGTSNTNSNIGFGSSYIYNSMSRGCYDYGFIPW